MTFPLAGKPEPFNPFDNNNNVKRSKRQENRISRQTGGKRQPRSGAIPLIPGDVDGSKMNGQPVLIEAKITGTMSHSISVKKLKKITREAAVLSKSPAYWITFESMPTPYPKDWVLVPTDLIDWDK